MELLQLSQRFNVDLVNIANIYQTASFAYEPLLLTSCFPLKSKQFFECTRYSSSEAVLAGMAPQSTSKHSVNNLYPPTNYYVRDLNLTSELGITKRLESHI